MGGCSKSFGSFLGGGVCFLVACDALMCRNFEEDDLFECDQDTSELVQKVLVWVMCETEGVAFEGVRQVEAGQAVCGTVEAGVSVCAGLDGGCKDGFELRSVDAGGVRDVEG